MFAPSMRFHTHRRVAAFALAVDLIAACAGLAYAVYAAYSGDVPTAALVGLASIAAAVLGVLAYCQFALIYKLESNTYRLYDAILDAHEVARRQTELLKTIADNAPLSDHAKRVIYREKDHEFLQDAIHATIVRQDWEAAEHLIQSLDEEFGYAQEAQELRGEVQRAREATIEEKVEAAVKRFDKLCASGKWEQARRETRRLMKLFPDNEHIGGLEGEIELRRQKYKRDLLKSYDEATRRNEVDQATRLLYELDEYLSPSEGTALKESARGVFRAKLQQMGVQFSLAVTDKQYESAIEIGERIAREFPNSRYAQEIREKMSTLRQRVAHE